MERRKFLIGAGSLAAGAAAATGTGAFSSVSANRAVNVNVAGDASALLALDKSTAGENSDYAKTLTDGTVQIDISGDNGNLAENPSGVNADATTKILDIFRVRNQGTQNVFVWVPPLGGDLDQYGLEGPKSLAVDPQASGLPNQVSYTDASSLSLTSVGLDDTEEEDHNRDAFPEEAGYYEPEDFTLAPGQSFEFGLYIQDSGSDFNGSIAIPIHASADYAASVMTGQ